MWKWDNIFFCLYLVWWAILRVITHNPADKRAESAGWPRHHHFQLREMRWSPLSTSPGPRLHASALITIVWSLLTTLHFLVSHVSFSVLTHADDLASLLPKLVLFAGTWEQLSLPNIISLALIFFRGKGALTFFSKFG